MVATSDDMFRQLWLDWAIQAFNEQQEHYEKLEAYYNGDHELEFATDRWRETFGGEFEEFSDNWCGVVVDSLVSRMAVKGWDADGSQAKEMKKLAQEISDYNDLPAEELDLYTGTVSKGDGYLLVWESEDDPGEVDMVYHDPLEVNVIYDPENKRKIARAAKHWYDLEGRRHLRLYFDDHIEAYFIPDDTQAAFLTGFRLPDDRSELPPQWESEGPDIPNPYGRVPVFHFRNKRQNSTHGQSEIEVVIPVQNAVNKMLMDLMVGSEFGSFRQKWMTGAGHPPEGWKAGSGRVWATTDPNARFGEFGQIDLDPITKAIDSLIGHIAKITNTPMHYLRPSGDMPSGEALKTAESGLVTKAAQRAKTWGPAWADAMSFAMQIKENRFEPIPRDERVTPLWDAFDIRHDLEQAQTAQLKALLGIPLEKLWMEHFGYDDEQIAEFKKINADIVASVLAAAAAQAGQVPPGAPSDATGPNLTQVLAMLGKGETSKTAAGEATPSPQPNTGPPASPTRRARGFRD